MDIVDAQIHMGPGRIEETLSAMDALEKGAIANPDENRMVGHYWLRAPELAPTKELQDEIVQCYASIRGFALETHKSGEMLPIRCATRLHRRDGRNYRVDDELADPQDRDRNERAHDPQRQNRQRVAAVRLIDEPD